MPRRRWSFLMAPMDHGFIRALDDLHRGRLTAPGRALAWIALASGVLLLGGITPLLTWAFATLVPLLVFSVLCGLPFRPPVRLRRRLPPPPSAGDTWGYDAEVTNLGSRPLKGIYIQERGLPAELRPVEDPPWIARLEPGETAVVRMRLRCSLRGEYALGGLEACSAAPSGLVKSSTRSPGRDRVLVYPRFKRIEAFDVPVGRSHQPGGIPVASHVGESAEFHGLRDWRDGDRPRDVHWPSFARSGRLVVREFQEEYYVRLALVLDVAAPHPRDEAVFEKAVSLAASIADALARREYIIDIFAAGRQVHHFQAGRALAHVENILELLACLESGDTLDPGALEAALVPEARSLSAVVFVMTDWDPGRATVVGKMRALGVAVRVLCARPGVRPLDLEPDERVEDL